MSGLFHDIATPVFKHCVDFLNGDYINQESTEDLTTETIKNSSEIMKLLKRDNIELNQVNDYHIYPIADNDTPKLSADRLEYSLSNALFTYKICDLNAIKKIYNDIVVGHDEEGITELSFQSEEIACKFVEYTSKLSIIYREDRTRYSMQLIADILKKSNEEKVIFKKDLYSMKESEIISIIENSKYKDIFSKWRKAKKINYSQDKPENVYSVHVNSKVRYINPLVNGKRISSISIEAKNMIENNLAYNMTNYVYLDFEI